MPNHCTNKLTVSGELKQLKKFIKSVDKGEKQHLDFNGVVPMPKELEGTDAPSEQNEKTAELEKKYGVSNWYTWSVLNWGTKWNAYDVLEWQTFYSDEIASTEFLTAWGPPTKFFINASKKFPTLTFENHYIDECGLFVGGYKIKNGEIFDEELFENENMFSKEAMEFRTNNFDFCFALDCDYEVEARLNYIKNNPDDADKGELKKLKTILKKLKPISKK